MAYPARAINVADLNDVPGGVGGLVGAIAATGATIAAGWRLFKMWGPGDANAAANSKEQIAALDTLKQMLAEERDARRKDNAEAALELSVERTARQAAEARADKFANDRNEALQQVWEMKGRLDSMTEQLTRMTERIASQDKEIARMTELMKTTNGTP